MDIITSIKKVGSYYKARLLVLDSYYRGSFYSKITFVTKKDARDYAQTWRIESQKAGYIT